MRARKEISGDEMDMWTITEIYEICGKYQKRNVLGIGIIIAWHTRAHIYSGHMPVINGKIFYKDVAPLAHCIAAPGKRSNRNFFSTESSRPAWAVLDAKGKSNFFWSERL